MCKDSVVFSKTQIYIKALLFIVAEVIMYVLNHWKLVVQLLSFGSLCNILMLKMGSSS